MSANPTKASAFDRVQKIKSTCQI